MVLSRGATYDEPPCCVFIGGITKYLESIFVYQNGNCSCPRDRRCKSSSFNDQRSLGTSITFRMNTMKSASEDHVHLSSLEQVYAIQLPAHPHHSISISAPEGTFRHHDAYFVPEGSIPPRFRVRLCRTGASVHRSVRSSQFFAYTLLFFHLF